ncbi:hypothetical protein CMUS01_03602 [Colletotrichum musicola]|uniref:Uncharacterized protein n=1 Tax=Colletotrichum musicola TaxID=2175873 RepID=A0A8H6NRU5_9PEZI|nr:hypothetical protein CMUS01_03602 [Colletotrichum musicola]
MALAKWNSVALPPNWIGSAFPGDIIHASWHLGIAGASRLLVQNTTTQPLRLAEDQTVYRNCVNSVFTAQLTPQTSSSAHATSFRSARSCPMQTPEPQEQQQQQYRHRQPNFIATSATTACL